MSTTTAFSPDYASARQRFRQAQAVAEGLARFIAKCNGIAVNDKHHKQIEACRDHVPPPVSIAALEAFEIIRGMPTRDRIDFHHLNDNVGQDHQKLETRAAECVEGLYTIESEIFGLRLFRAGPC